MMYTINQNDRDIYSTYRYFNLRTTPEKEDKDKKKNTTYRH